MMRGVLPDGARSAGVWPPPPVEEIGLPSIWAPPIPPAGKLMGWDAGVALSKLRPGVAPEPPSSGEFRSVHGA